MSYSKCVNVAERFTPKEISQLEAEIKKIGGNGNEAARQAGRNILAKLEEMRSAIQDAVSPKVEEPSFSSRQPVTDWAKEKLRETHGDIEDQFRAAAGHGFDALTSSEARYLTNFRPADAIRNRIADAARQGSQGLLPDDASYSRRVNNLGLYSALEEGVSNLTTKAAPAQAWKDAIKGLVNKGAVKADEVEWSGVNEWLDTQQGKVTREALAQYLSEGGVKVEEVDGTYQGETTPYSKRNLVLPGGTNHREVLLTLPAKQGPSPDDAAKQMFGRRYNDLSPYQQDQARRMAKANDEANYRSSHWDQPNVLAHIRLNDRVDADGKKVLFVEEVQSDWGQEGKKKGFASGDWEAPYKEWERSLRERAKSFYLDAAETDEERASAISMGEKLAAREDLGSIATVMGERPQMAEAWAKATALRDRVPAAPFVDKTDKWLNLALKRIITLAVQEGYDKIAFVNGEQSADRYDLSKQVESISYKDNGDGTYKLVAAAKDRGIAIPEQTVNKENLPDVVGKDVADKIISGEGSAFPKGSVSEGMKRLSGLDLKVGGEGMRAFYDTIVPNAVKALAKKLGGEVGPVHLGGSGYGLTRVIGKGWQVVDARNLPVNDRTFKNQQDAAKWIVENDPTRKQPGLTITPAMREKVGQGLPSFSRRQKAKAEPGFNWLLQWVPGLRLNEMGRNEFAPTALVYDVGVKILNPLLDKIRLKPISKELSASIRKMKLEIQAAQEKAANVAEKMSTLKPEERELISDIIEKELKAGVKPEKKLVALATVLSKAMSEQSAELVRLGMLDQNTASFYDGEYLPRFYETHLINDATKQWSKMTAKLLSRPKAMQGIEGKSLHSRGLWRDVPVGELDDWKQKGWMERDTRTVKNGETVRIWRDFSKDEREKMKEIRDASFRFVMGYMRSQKDIALGRLYENLSQTLAKAQEPLESGWVQVPDSKIGGINTRRYGKLSGMWVPREVMDHLSAQDNTFENAAVKAYKKALSYWKEGKVVLNPVSHVNNVVSNITAAHFAGVSYWDQHKYALATKDLITKSPMVDEAKKAGLFLGSFSSEEIKDLLPENLRILASKADSGGKRAAEGVMNLLTFGFGSLSGKKQSLVRKGMMTAYEAEDSFFRYLLYRDARKRGLSPEDAVTHAQKYIFAYDDLPQGARFIRDTGLPFFSYTYKAIPMLAETALKYPWRYAAPASLVWALNTLGYAVAAAADDDDLDEIIKRYFADEEFREKVSGMKDEDQKNLPPWMKGAGLTMGVNKTIRLGTDEITELPVFLDVSRWLPGGDLFDVTGNAGGIPWPAPLTPSNPILTTFGGVFMNKDFFTGKEIMLEGNTRGENASTLGGWAWRQFAPAIAVGNYHWDRTLQTIANATGKEFTWGPFDYTGSDKQGLPYQPLYSAANTFGVKARPIDLEMSQQINESKRKSLIRELDKSMRNLRRSIGKGAVSEEAGEAQIERIETKIERLREGLDVNGNPIE